MVGFAICMCVICLRGVCLLRVVQTDASMRGGMDVCGADFVMAFTQLGPVRDVVKSVRGLCTEDAQRPLFKQHSVGHRDKLR